MENNHPADVHQRNAKRMGVIMEKLPKLASFFERLSEANREKKEANEGNES
jgi:hypothetical protein